MSGDMESHSLAPAPTESIPLLAIHDGLRPSAATQRIAKTRVLTLSANWMAVCLLYVWALKLLFMITRQITIKINLFTIFRFFINSIIFQKKY